MRTYKCLKGNSYCLDEFCLVPIRDQDKMHIMKWRNDQMQHLRQNRPLLKEDQELYFKNVVEELFDQENPPQILFSYLHNGRCIGYGGLVHINWQSKNAEVSFLMDTKNIDKKEELHWKTFLKLIDMVVFEDLNFHKIFAYAYDIRTHLYQYLLASDFVLEARLKDHYLLNERYYDVVIHSKFNINK